MTDWNGDPWDLTEGDWIQAYVMDADGDQTLSTYVGPTLSVNPDLDHVWGWGWPDGATITVNGSSWTTPTVCSANTAYWYHYMEPVQGPYALRPCWARDRLPGGVPRPARARRGHRSGTVVTMADTTGAHAPSRLPTSA